MTPVEVEKLKKIKQLVDSLLSPLTLVSQENSQASLKTQDSATSSAIIDDQVQTMQSVTAALSDDLKKHLTFEETPSMMILKPKQFIRSKKDFNEILTLARSKGGRYVGDGKSSHFEIPKNSASKNQR